MKKPLLPGAHWSLGPWWFLRDAYFLKRVAAALILYGTVLALTLPMSMKGLVDESIELASRALGCVFFLSTAVAATLAWRRALLQRWRRIHIVLCGSATWGVLFLALILIARQAMSVRGGLGLLLIAGGYYILVRIRSRPVS